MPPPSGPSPSAPLYYFCTECDTYLAREQLPPGSFVRVDTGAIPVSPNPADQLQPLTVFESMCVSPGRPFRFVYVCKVGYGRSADLLTKCSRGHVIAFPNAPAEAWHSTFPCPLEDVPKAIQVILLTVAKDRTDLIKKARKQKATFVRGVVVCQWARHIANLQSQGTGRGAR